MAIKTIPMLPMRNASETDKDEHLFDTKKVVHSKDDAKQLNYLLKSSAHGKSSSTKDSNDNGTNYAVSAKSKYGISKITGKPRTSSPEGFKASAKCRPEVAPGHNRRDADWVKNRENVDPTGYHKTYLDFDSVEKSYAEVFKDALDEYNSRQTRNDRKITNYYRKIMEDGRNGTMKKNADVDTHRKLVYEFIFQIGKRDNRLDTKKSIELLEKFVLEYIPEHYPNLKAIGIYLHADEFTIDPVTKQRLDGSVHIHFDFIPVAHALTKEEQEEEKKWRAELETKAREEAKARGEEFSKTKFDEQDWEMLRVQKFGKALQKGILLQSSMSGACAEMGFRTKGKLTAQIQMEEDIRTALLDFTESYGIKVNREVDKNRDEEVSIDAYKIREDNKKLLEQIQQDLEKETAIKKENQKSLEDISVREENVKNLEVEKADAERKSQEANALKEKVTPYVERIDKLVENEQAIEKKQREQDARDKTLDEKSEKIINNETESLNRIANKQTELNSSISDYKTLKESVEADKITNQENAKINSDNAAINEANAKENKRKADDFYEKESRYRMLNSFCGQVDEINVNLNQIAEQMGKDLRDTSVTYREAINNGITTFKTKCNQILLKFKDAIRGFKTFLEGKTSKDFRNLADDMDRNKTGTFEEYEKKYMAEELDWQVQQRIEKYTLKPVKKRSWEMGRD